MTVREHVMPYVLVLGGAALCVVFLMGSTWSGGTEQSDASVGRSASKSAGRCEAREAADAALPTCVHLTWKPKA